MSIARMGSHSSRNGNNQEPPGSAEVRELRETAQKITQIQNIGILDGLLLRCPRFLVCGRPSMINQFLSAFTHVPLSTEDIPSNYATKITLRQHPKSFCRIGIKPGSARINEESTILKSFKHECAVESNLLPELINRARDLLKSMSHDEISDDTLEIVVHRPNHPCLTLVDMPGCRDYPLEGVHEASQKLIKKGSKYFNIILAVASTKLESGIQRALKIARQLDPTGTGTLGIITDVEYLPEGSALEQTYIQLTKNEQVELEEGWHALCSIASTGNILDRRVIEDKVFNRTQWTAVDGSLLGAKGLLSRLHIMRWRLPVKAALSKLHACSEWLAVEIDKRVDQHHQDLGRLGPPRPSLQQQRGFLLRASSRFSRILDQAVTGLYEDAFFDYSLEASHARQHDPRRLRTCIHRLNKFFVEAMKIRGCSHHVKGITYEGVLVLPRSNPYIGEWKVVEMDRTMFEREVRSQVVQSHDSPSLGLVYQSLVSQLFRSQSKPWGDLARHHLLMAWQTVRFFVSDLLRCVTDEDTHSRLMNHILEDRLEVVKCHLLKKLEELTACYKRGHLLPVDNDFLARIHSTDGQCWSAPVFDSDSFATAMIIKQMQAYYEVSPLRDAVIKPRLTYNKAEIVTFENNVVNLAIENCLLAPLVDLFDNQTINNLSNEEIQKLALETSTQSQQRACAQAAIENLRSAQSTLSHLSRPSLDKPPDITAFNPRSCILLRSTDSSGNRYNTSPMFGHTAEGPEYIFAPRIPGFSLMNFAPSTVGFVWYVSQQHIEEL